MRHGLFAGGGFVEDAMTFEGNTARYPDHEIFTAAMLLTNSPLFSYREPGWIWSPAFLKPLLSRHADNAVLGQPEEWMIIKASSFCVRDAASTHVPARRRIRGSVCASA